MTRRAQPTIRDYQMVKISNCFSYIGRSTDEEKKIPNTYRQEKKNSTRLKNKHENDANVADSRRQYARNITAKREN